MQLRWLFMCVAFGAVLLAVVAATQGFTVRTALLAVSLLVCPLLGVWVMRGSRGQMRRDDTRGHAR